MKQQIPYLHLKVWNILGCEILLITVVHLYMIGPCLLNNKKKKKNPQNNT